MNRGSGGRETTAAAAILHQSEVQLDSAAGGLEFLAPEAVSGEAVGTATDMWAFGVILYVLLRYGTLTPRRTRGPKTLLQTISQATFA